MASFEINLGMTPRESNSTVARAEGSESDWFDVVVDGERFSAASQPEQAACVLRELVVACLALAEGRKSKAHIPLCDAPWEICLVARGTTLSVTLFRAGPIPEVRLLDRPIGVLDLARQARTAFESVAPLVDETFAGELAALVERFEHAARTPTQPPPMAPEMLVRWQSAAVERDGAPRPLRLAFESLIGNAGASEGDGVRADLHALLFRGRVALEIRGRRGELAPGFVFLQIERLLSLVRPLVEAAQARRALHLRVAAGDSMLAVRLGRDGKLALTLAHPDSPTFTAPALELREFTVPVIEAALAIARAAIRCDRARARNLRLRTLRTEAHTLQRLMRDLGEVRNKLNDDPGRYRASAIPAIPATASTPQGIDLSSAIRLRYVERWRAEIEGLDLRGTLLCGDRLIVPGARETVALDREQGVVLWSRPLPRAATTLAGGDVLRLTPRGDVELRDVRDGEVLWASRIAPRVGAPALAFTITASGLPRIVILAEGERRLVAMDLRTGEPRWRHSARLGGAFRMRRLGRLLVVASGESAIRALDLASGEVVWRCTTDGPVTLVPAVHRETVFAVAGVPARGACSLVAVDAFTGAPKWTAEHAASAVSAPVGARDVVALALSGRDGVHIVGYGVEDGARVFTIPVGTAPISGGTVALGAFDDLIVANLPNGRVIGIDAATRSTRWIRTLAAPVADDAPRRLDVQLRAGALFVPQSSLAVLRPNDGSTIANIDACDLVPDLVRIDEQCALYVGEESGHLGSYALGPRLSVVRPAND